MNIKIILTDCDDFLNTELMDEKIGITNMLYSKYKEIFKLISDDVIKREKQLKYGLENARARIQLEMKITPEGFENVEIAFRLRKNDGTYFNFMYDAEFIYGEEKFVLK